MSVHGEGDEIAVSSFHRHEGISRGHDCIQKSLPTRCVSTIGPVQLVLCLPFKTPDEAALARIGWSPLDYLIFSLVLINSSDSSWLCDCLR